MLHLLPIPRHLELRDGAFSLTPDMCIVLEANSGMLACTGARQLQEEVYAACGLHVDIRLGKARARDIHLSVEAAEPAQQDVCTF